MRRNLLSPGKQSDGAKELGLRAHHVGQGQRAWGRGDPLLPLRSRQRMGYLDQEDIRADEFHDAIAVVIAQTQCLSAVQLGHDPLEAGGGVQDTLHSASRSARMAGTPMS